MESARKLYDYLEISEYLIPADMENGFLTENKGRDGQEYYFYFDGSTSAAINKATGEIVTDDARIEELFC